MEEEDISNTLPEFLCEMKQLFLIFWFRQSSEKY